MIISCHIGKTAGTTFRRLLADAFKYRLLLDYQDQVGLDNPEARAARASHLQAVRRDAAALERNYQVIHGHFLADKYVGVFRTCDVCAFFRAPVERVVSTYYYLLRNPGIPHPLVRQFHEAGTTLEEYIESDNATNVQTRYLNGLAIDDLAFCGIFERFDESLVLFNQRFGTNLRPGIAENVNPARSGANYPISERVRARIVERNQQDIVLYAAACARFARDCRRPTLAALAV